MAYIFDKIDQTIVDFWKSNGLQESDFYCRDCGKLLIDIDELQGLEYFAVSKFGKKTVKKPFIRHKESRKRYVESEKNRWCVNGRLLSGKYYFRHLCWKCFFKKLRLTEDIARKARKSTWYAKLLEGNDVIPPTWASPSQYYKLMFDITDSELDAERAKFDTASLKSFIRRKGEVEGRAAYEAYKQRQAYTCSKEYMSKTRGWSEDDWSKFNASRASTKENFVKRYGKDAGNEKWKKYCAHEAYAGCSLSYFIDKYGKEDGQLKYLEVNARKAVTLDNFIKKYGKKEGKKKYMLISSKASKVSQLLFSKIDKYLGKFATNSQYEYKNGELALNLFFEDGTCQTCRPDYVLHTKIIEFNGDFWHANPAFYDSDDILFANTNEKAKDIWQRDAKRKAALEKLGYKVKVVWEKDFYDDQQKVVEDCVNFLRA